ncbi:GDSL esterase/lipase At1g71250-like [Telopea speciosissima]|uniref:GDSL esterase/lipase At1g71250-like n=1 Tax=Telopea speciosissima TaxID=54955 RepID=UPI001CC398BE|nr:GDSL esterase/lipase At1g71250-like [Telopea speciosissima]
MKMENTNSWSLVNAARLLISIVVVILHLGSRWVIGAPQATAMFVFGDSLIDNGNNNYLLGSLAKANYLPYGVDFEQGATGRFTNGKTIIDLLGDKLGLPYLPAFADPLTVGTRILKGVNYASAAGGILDISGLHLGQRFSLRQQVISFGITLSQLRIQLGGMNMNLSEYLAKSIAVMALGSNDYVNNYLMPSLYPTSFIYNPRDYADLLVNQYSTQILALHSLGLRKFFLAGLGPIGCSPSQARGQCATGVNDMMGLFNERLRSLVDLLNANHPGSIFAYGNTYGVFGDILNNPAAYGFMITTRGCCVLGVNQGTCLPLSTPCPNRREYVFWDAFHPTEAVDEILAQRAYAGPPSDCYPINVQQIAQM